MTHEPPVTRRAFLKAAAAATVLSQVPSGAPAGARRPNILFVLSDSHRAASTGCYGESQIHTPSFDRLASEGLRLTTAISNTPICRPYRASLMTGTFGHHNGMLANISERNFGVRRGRQWTPGGLPTLGETFARAGYCCGYVGKWHLGNVNLDPGPLRFGFDDFWAAAKTPTHDYYNWTYHTGRRTTIEGGGYFRPRLETDLAIDFLTQQGPSPWLLILGWGAPHEPLTPPNEFLHYHDIRLPPNVPRRAHAFAYTHLPYYYAMIEAIDHELGRLLDAVAALGLERDTIVVYTSDHGNMMGSHDLSGKHLPYSESTRVPFLIRWPGRIASGATLDTPLGAPDVFPTLAGLAGLPAPTGIDGVDLAGALRGRAGARQPESTYIAAHETEMIPWPGWRGVRTPRYLYARQEQRPWLLFDLQADPHEKRNLVQDDRTLRRRMDALTHSLMETHGDTWRGT